MGSPYPSARARHAKVMTEVVISITLGLLRNSQWTQPRGFGFVRRTPLPRETSAREYQRQCCQPLAPTKP